MELLTGISVSLNKIGYDLTIAVAPDSRQEIDSLHRMVQGKRVDGIILTMTKTQDDRITYLLDNNFPLFCMAEQKILANMLSLTWMENLP